MNSYEFLKFLTVKLTADKLADTKGRTCTATGFYVVINGAAYIVTAKHFAEETEQNVTISAHYTDSDTVVTVPITAYVEWDASEEFDIAYCKIKPYEKKFKEITGHNMFYTAISEKNIMTKDDLSKLNILSEILTMGYPSGTSSTHHECPLFKKGYFSSMPSDFTEDGEGYLDLCISQGMSGSPILQNDKIVGAVTHVFVNDPTRGYGIFIENMLAEAEKIK